MEPRIVMGIDQSLTCTGVCILNADSEVIHVEAIRTKKQNDDWITDTLNRTEHIHMVISGLIAEYKVTRIHMESPSLASVGRSTRSLAMLFGILVYSLEHEVDHDYVTVVPTQLKKFATGKGNARKEQMLEAIEDTDLTLFKQLSILPKSHGRYDIADAYWLAKFK